ncbi:hypothetical protein [Mycolicibacter nonchromogenicus]|uniref:hypothetical protein n=1 Tax=Mycolicibacter nonchromogenicus TaxID=1782 RepID=UPI000A995673|nr:hypothetical protein [Mycolicibacter nonchromogenicus]
MTQRSRRASRILLWVAMCGLLASCAIGLPAESRPSDRPITKLTKAMLVDPASLPQLDGGEWAVGKIRSEDQPQPTDKYVPAECAPLYGEVQHTQRSSVRFRGGPSGPYVNLWLYVTPQPPDVKTLLSQCGTVSYRSSGPYPPPKVKPVTVPEVPPWAVAVDKNENVHVMGSYRGVFLSADSSDGLTDVAVKVFNEQAAKLAAA